MSEHDETGVLISLPFDLAERLDDVLKVLLIRERLYKGAMAAAPSWAQMRQVDLADLNELQQRLEAATAERHTSNAGE